MLGNIIGPKLCRLRKGLIVFGGSSTGKNQPLAKLH